MDHNAWNSVWQTDCFLAVCYRIAGSASVAAGIRVDQKEMEGTHTMMTPDEFTAPQPSGTASPWAQFLAEMRAYFVSNVAASVITVWSMFLFAGGLIFLIYFWSIGFMPEIDAKAFVTLLAASALTGGFLFILLSFYWVAPGYLWVQCTRHSESLKSPLWFFLPMTGVALTALLSSVLILKWWWIAPLLVFLIAPLPLFFPFGKVRDWISVSPRRSLESLKRLRNKRFIETFRTVRYFYWISAGPRRSLESLKRLRNKRFTETFKTVGSLYSSLIVSTFVFIPLFSIIYNLIKRNPDLRENFTSLVVSSMLGIIYILMSNFVVIKLSHTYQGSYKEFVQYIVVGTASVFILFLMLQALPFIPEKVMNIYKFGNFRNAFLVVDEVGCSIVHHHGIKITPYTLDSSTVNPPSPPKMTCSLSKVTILSRLGSTYYLIAFRDDQTSVHFTMPGQNVLSWSVKELN
jgi:hypothetical protein